MTTFTEYWEKYKKVPYYCKPIMEWFEEVGDAIQHGGISINESDQHRLSIAMRHAADTCRRCKCPEEEEGKLIIPPVKPTPKIPEMPITKPPILKILKEDRV